MMILLLRIYKFAMNVVYFFLKFLKTKNNRIVFLSRQDNLPSIDFIYLINDIKKRYPNYEIKVLTKRMEKDNLIQIFSYVFHPFKQLYYLATSSICITDGYQMSISATTHKKDLTIIQIWHSLGAIKKFGYMSLKTDKEKKMAKVMNMHKNYDLIISGSKKMTKYLSKCFNYDYKYFKELGLPRIDYLISTKEENRNMIYKKYPELKNKKIILYAPTFRKSEKYQVNELINKFSNSKWQLIIKKHPRMKIDIPSIYRYDEFTSLELLSVADYLITDYSSIQIEAAILNVPIMLYVYDYDDYKENEGINTNLLTDLEGYAFKDINELFNAIKLDKYNKKVLDDFKKKYVTNDDGKATMRIVDGIINEVKKKNKKSIN